MHNSSVHASKHAPGFGAKNVHISDRQVVARDGDIKVVFERKPDCVLQGKVELSVSNKLVQSHRVLQLRCWRFARGVSAERAMRARHFENGRTIDFGHDGSRRIAGLPKSTRREQDPNDGQ